MGKGYLCCQWASLWILALSVESRNKIMSVRRTKGPGGKEMHVIAVLGRTKRTSMIHRYLGRQLSKIWQDEPMHRKAYTSYIHYWCKKNFKDFFYLFFFRGGVGNLLVIYIYFINRIMKSILQELRYGTYGLLPAYSSYIHTWFFFLPGQSSFLPVFERGKW